MKIRVLVCGWDGSQHVEEREVPEDYLKIQLPEEEEANQ